MIEDNYTVVNKSEECLHGWFLPDLHVLEAKTFIKSTGTVSKAALLRSIQIHINLSPSILSLQD